MNYEIFTLINNLSGRSEILDKIGIFFATDFSYIIIGILLLLFICTKLKITTFKIAKIDKMLFVSLLSAIVARLIFVPLIRFFYYSPRPFLENNISLLIPFQDNISSFPSGHAAFFFALAMSVYFYNKKLGILFFIFATLNGLARIFVGVHWPSDIIGGAVVGIISAVLVKYLIK